MATAPATALLPHVDELVLEYLLFRGFTRSFQALAAERKRDRAKGFDVEQITGQLLGLVQTYHLDAILDAWNFLEARFFSRLDGSFTATIRQLEDSWLRLYLVNAIKSGHVDKAVDFFKLLADKLNAKDGKAGGDSWHRWFILPYVQHPESDPFFRPYFEKQWAESLVTSFRNFLSLVFRNMPLPKLLALQVARVDEPSLRLRLKTSQSECSRLRHHNAQSAERIRQLEDAGQKMFRMVETLVQHSFAEHFAATSEVSVWTDRIPEDDEGEEPPVVLKALNTLSSQLRDLRDAFGPATRHDTTYRDVALSSALQDPIAVKLHTVAASSAASNDEGTVAILGLSSPSSSSQQSFESASSPAHQIRKKTHSPVLVDEVVMAEEPSGRGEEAICRYSHDGQRLVVACRGLQTIRVFDVDTVNHTSERELIQTDSPVVGVDWIAQSHCLVHALEDGTITVWDTETKARTFIISYNADERRPSLLACARSSAIGAVALVSNEADQAERIRIQFFAFEDQAIRVVSSVELPEPTDLRSLHWANDGSALAIAESDGRVSLLSPSEARSLGSWRLGTGDAPLASITFGSDNQSLLAVEASGDRVAEWRIHDLLATSTAEVPPSISYRLPSQLTPDRETTRRQIEIQTARFTFAVSSCASSMASYWTVFTRGISDPILTTPVQVAGHIDALAWRPIANTLSAKTADGKLTTWKVSH